MPQRSLVGWSHSGEAVTRMHTESSIRYAYFKLLAERPAYGFRWHRHSSCHHCTICAGNTVWHLNRVLNPLCCADLHIHAVVELSDGIFDELHINGLSSHRCSQSRNTVHLSGACQSHPRLVAVRHSGSEACTLCRYRQAKLWRRIALQVYKRHAQSPSIRTLLLYTVCRYPPLPPSDHLVGAALAGASTAKGSQDPDGGSSSINTGGQGRLGSRDLGASKQPRSDEGPSSSAKRPRGGVVPQLTSDSGKKGMARRRCAAGAPKRGPGC